MAHQRPADITPATIEQNLRRLLRDGVRPAKLHAYPGLLSLNAVGAFARVEDDPVFALEALIASCIARLGDGLEGQALTLLLGLSADSRGRLLKDRRRLAADCFDLLPSTFRRRYEGELIADLTMEIWRCELRASPDSIGI